MKFSKIVLVFTALCAFYVNQGTAQPVEDTNNQDNNLLNRFQQMVDESGRYQTYKVIPITKLDDMLGQMEDSLTKYYQDLHSGKEQILTARQERQQALDELGHTREELEKSLAFNAQISFLGIDFNKETYHILVWSFTGLLLLSLVILYLRYKASHRITRNTVNDLQELQREFEEFRKSANEKQVVIKRELQTAVNQLEERKGR